MARKAAQESLGCLLIHVKRMQLKPSKRTRKLSNMKKTLITMTSATLLATSSVHAALNLVTDGAFNSGETGTLNSSSTPWYDPASGGLTVINNANTNPFTGDPDSAILTAPTIGSTALAQHLTGLASGLGYTLNFWLADEGNSGVLMVILGGAVVDTITVPNNSIYTHYNINGTAGAAPILEFAWASSTPGAAVDIDSVSVAVPEPTTMVAGALMLLPFAASTLRLRKKASA